MADIKFKVQGTYPPFAVELRVGSEIGPVVDSLVAQSADTFYYFYNVSAATEYYIIGYDTTSGQDVVETGFTVTTTTTTTTLSPTTTTTTTLSPTTTTTTTLSPTTTTTTTTVAPTTTTSPIVDKIYYGFAPTSFGDPDVNDTNTNSATPNSQTFRMWFSTSDNYDGIGSGTGLPLTSAVNFDVTPSMIGTPVTTYTATTHSNVTGISTPYINPMGVTITNIGLPIGEKQGYIDFEYALAGLTVGETVEVHNLISIDDFKLQTLPTRGSAGTTYGIISSTSGSASGSWAIQKLV